MSVVFFMTLPDLVLVLTLVAFADQLLPRAGRAGALPWRNSARQGQISATGFEQLHASLSPGKQHELRERRSALVLPDDEDDGAPPHRTTVDLENGTVVVRMPGARGQGARAPAVQASPRRATAGGRSPAREATMSSTWRVSATSCTR